MDGLDIHTVVYTDPDYPFTLYFRCHAEDKTDAKEQCKNAYPNCTVVKVNDGLSTAH